MLEISYIATMLCTFTWTFFEQRESETIFYALKSPRFALLQKLWHRNSALKQRLQTRKRRQYRASCTAHFGTPSMYIKSPSTLVRLTAFQFVRLEFRMIQYWLRNSSSICSSILSESGSNFSMITPSPVKTGWRNCQNGQSSTSRDRPGAVAK